MEEWKWIKYKGIDYTNKYMVSNEGRIKSVDRFTKKNNQFFEGKILKQRNGRKNKNNNSYKTITLWNDGEKKI